jgi:hypothetical protein
MLLYCTNRKYKKSKKNTVYLESEFENFLGPQMVYFRTGYGRKNHFLEISEPSMKLWTKYEIESAMFHKMLIFTLELTSF